ncbi:MAG: DNA pilot protein [Microviridae sp.]|nr:MAG: DNA pilot protein [Microviridae sp.]
MANDQWGAIAGQAVQTMGNYAVSVAANKRQFKNQQKAMAMQQQYNKELWDYQNAYNTPQAQMERLKAAGLNPRLVYGSGASAPGNAGPIAPTEVPSEQAARVEVPNIYMSRLVARQMDAQYAATTQKVESAKVQAELLQTKTALENLRLMRENLRAKNYADLNEAEKSTAQFIALRTQEQFANEKSKGNLMDQLHGFRSEFNKKMLSTADLEIAFKENRNELAKLGIYSSDDAKLRIVVQAANRLGIDLDDLVKRGYEQLKYLFGVKD